MPVRTKLLASGRSSSATSSVVYTVPADETCIIKQMTFFNLSTTTATVVQLLVDTAANNQTVWREFTLGTRAQDRVEMWTVLLPGYEVALSNSAAVGVNYWMSGTELEGVAD